MQEQLPRGHGGSQSFNIYFFLCEPLCPPWLIIFMFLTSRLIVPEIFMQLHLETHG